MDCIDGPLKGQNFRLEGGPAFLFGRYAKMGFCLAADPTCSLLHFLIDTSDERIRILDLGSSNGIIVNNIHFGGMHGEPMQEFFPLKSGDTILAGSSLLRLTVVSKEDLDDSFFLPDTTAQDEHNPDESWWDSDFWNSCADTTDTVSDTDDFRRIFPFVKGYTLLAEIKGDPGSTIYRAVKDDTGAEATVRILYPGKRENRRPLALFHREIQMTKQFDHPNIIRYLDDGVTNGAPYLAVEYVDGGTVEDLIRRSPGGRMELPQAVPLFIQLLEAVAYMHSRYFVHRDIRPGNILLALRGGGMHAAKLAGLGLARKFSGMETAEFSPVAAEKEAPEYMPPEQTANFPWVVPQSDVFGCAMTLHQMLDGMAACDVEGSGQPAPTPGRMPARIPALRPEISRPIRDVIAKALSPLPADRYEHASAMLLAFKHALG